MPPLPPPAPSRSRSRSRDRFQARVAGVIAAHRRNLRCRRAGQKGQAARRTRAIDKHLLGILIEYLGRLLTGFTRRPPPSEVLVRRRQAEVRLSYLENGNFPANKFEVLPGLREFVQHNPDWREQLGLVSEDLSDIESRCTNDTISVHSSEHRLFARIVTETILSRTSFSVPLTKQNLPRSSLPASRQANRGNLQCCEPTLA